MEMCLIDVAIEEDTDRPAVEIVTAICNSCSANLQLPKNVKFVVTGEHQEVNGATMDVLRLDEYVFCPHCFAKVEEVITHCAEHGSLADHLFST